MHCELGKSLSCRFIYRHAYPVTNDSWLRTQNLPFNLWPPFWIMYFSSGLRPLVERFLRRKSVKWYGLCCNHLLEHVSAQEVFTMSYWSNLISLLLLTAVLLRTPGCFMSNSWIAAVHCRGNPDFGIRSECMSAENLCTTYYLVLLFSMWTPALRCCVYLFTCLCFTLCALHRCSPLCYFQFCLIFFVDEMAMDALSILPLRRYWLVILPFCIINPPQPSFLACPHFFFKYFDTNFDYIYCPSYSASQSFLNQF